MSPIPVLIDTDPGIDDSVAILFALLCPQLSVKAITTVSGNLKADICTKNALKVLNISTNPSAKAISVSQGDLTPLCRPYPKDPFSHGDDGLGELGIPDVNGKADGRWAPDAIIETANEVARTGQRLTILCLGPLTNLALALKKDPGLPSKIEKVIAIAGSFGFHSAGTVRATGDNPASEWNVYVDPEAADLVINSDLGPKFYAVGLDVTTRPDIDLSNSHRTKLAETVANASTTKPEAEFFQGVVSFGERKGFPSYCCLIDAAAVAVALDSSLVDFEFVRVVIETQSRISLGQTIVDQREHRPWLHLPKIYASTDIDATRFLDLVIETITRK